MLVLRADLRPLTRELRPDGNFREGDRRWLALTLLTDASRVAGEPTVRRGLETPACRLGRTRVRA